MRSKTEYFFTLLVSLSLIITSLSGEEGVAPEEDDSSTSDSKSALQQTRSKAVLGDSLKNIPDIIAESEEKHIGLFSSDPTEPFHKYWKKFDDHLKKRFNLDIGMAYTTLYQGATSKLHAPAQTFYQGAAGGDFDLFGVLTLQNQKKPLPSSIGFLSEVRNKYSSIPPRLLGDNIGSLWETVNAFTVQKYSLVQLWWEQHLIKDKLGFRLGKIDLTDYFNLYTFISSNFNFLSESLTDSLTIAFPSNGFGLVVGAFLPKNFYIRATIADANGVKTNLSTTFFSQCEYFTAVEIGYKPKNNPCREVNYNMTLWHSDARRRLHIPESKGIAFSLEQEIRKGVIPFLRFSFSDGKVRQVKQAIATGIGVISPFSRKDDECAFGFTWGKPSQKGLRNQYMVEGYYRLQLTPHFQITPDLQVIMNPTFNDKNSVVGIFGVRIRFEI